MEYIHLVIDNNFDTKNLTGPFLSLTCLYKIFGEVVRNAIAFEKKYFRNDDIKKIALEVDWCMKSFEIVCRHQDFNVHSFSNVS